MRASVWVVAILVSTLAACASAAMQVPPGVAKKAQPLAVEGRSSKGLREEFRLDAYRVGEVERTSNRATNRGLSGWQLQPTETRHRFDVQGPARTIHAECLERYEQGIVGLGKATRHLDCTCSDGDARLLELALVEGKGAAKLGDGASYQVSVLQKTESGKWKKLPLGYWFKGAHGEGAIELAEPGRAWLPKDLPEPERSALVCGYAGLLLYRRSP